MKKEIIALPDNFDDLSIDEKIKVALDTGNWMVRRSNNGTSYGGFEWSPIGEWTEAPDFDPSPHCGNGLHGSALEGFGYFNHDPRFEFCVTSGNRIVIDDNKIKVKKAMILCIDNTAINCLEGLSVGGSLDLRGTQITALPEGLSVGGYLYLGGTQIKNIQNKFKDKIIK